MSSWCGAATKQARQRSKNHAQCSLDLECVCGSENSKIQAQVHIEIPNLSKSPISMIPEVKLAILSLPCPRGRLNDSDQDMACGVVVTDKNVML